MGLEVKQRLHQSELESPATAAQDPTAVQKDPAPKKRPRRPEGLSEEHAKLLKQLQASSVPIEKRARGAVDPGVRDMVQGLKFSPP